MSVAWLVVAEESALSGVPEAARGLAESTAALVIGPRALAEQVAVAVDRVDWIETSPDRPPEAWALAAADHLAAAGARVVLTGNGAASRVVLGAVAARLGAAVLAPAQEIRTVEGGTSVNRLVYGGLAREDDVVPGPVCLVVEAGVADLATGTGKAAPIDAVEVTPLPITTSCDGVPERDGQDLARAARVIGVGRGLRDPANLEMVGELARALDAEIACSRPVAEDLGWLPHDRYLGVSGRRIAPRLYLMLGISGEVQHMIGVRDAQLIVAVNTDQRAPAVENADLAVIGDLRAVVPALVRQLESAGGGEHA